MITSINYLWKKLNGSVKFSVEIIDSQIKTSDKIKVTLLQDLEDIVESHNISNGYIYWLKNKKIKFSSNIPKSMQQQVRNLWSFQ